MERLYNILPHFLQNIMVTLYNVKSYRERYGGKYKAYRKLFKETDNFTLSELKEDQRKRYTALINHAIINSSYYRNALKNSSAADSIDNIKELPILNKEILRKHIQDIYTIPKHEGIRSKTGGTTGKSLEVIFTKENMQERFAMLDNFRSKTGYELGKRTAWFSGKSLLTNRDIKRNRFWKTDHLYKVRYYSTFHIKEAYLPHYITNLISFKPEYLVGFPSNLLEIAKYGLANNMAFPKGTVKAIFPTAENVLPEMREVVESFFHARIYDQYASSEGAPFIFECAQGNLHLELQSGVFEILDNENKPSREGRLVLTSFTTYGTPLIRYDIGDRLALSDANCGCSNSNPLVEAIQGREDDFVYSPENGKINLGNISNTLKGTKGIKKFQVLQHELNKILILVVPDTTDYSKTSEAVFLKNWRERMGDKMEIDIQITEDISVESSGKYRLVKNYIKHLL